MQTTAWKLNTKELGTCQWSAIDVHAFRVAAIQVKRWSLFRWNDNGHARVSIFIVFDDSVVDALVNESDGRQGSFYSFTGVKVIDACKSYHQKKGKPAFFITSRLHRHFAPAPDPSLAEDKAIIAAFGVDDESAAELRKCMESEYAPNPPDIMNRVCEVADAPEGEVIYTDKWGTYGLKKGVVTCHSVVLLECTA
jgi:hypothetical protein